MTMAGRIGVMDAGRLEQVATPRDLYEAPRSRWIAEFVGDVNLFEGEVIAREHGRLTITTREAGVIAVAEPRQPVTNDVVSVAIRPEKIKMSRRGSASDADAPQAINRLEGDGRRDQLSRRADQLQDQARQWRLVRPRVDGQYRAARHGRLSCEPARGGLVHVRRLRGAGAMSARRIFARPARFAAIAPYLWMVLFLPGAVRLRAEDQPVADRDRAAALYAGVRFHRRVLPRSRRPLANCRWTISGCWSRTISTFCPICAASSSP